MKKLILGLLICLMVTPIFAGQKMYTVSVASTAATNLIESGAYKSIVITADTNPIYISSYSTTATTYAHLLPGNETRTITAPGPIYVRGKAATVNVSYTTDKRYTD